MKSIIVSFCLLIVFEPRIAFCQPANDLTIIIEVLKIDTIPILEFQVENTETQIKKEKAQVVYFKLIKKFGKTKRKSKNLVITLVAQSDHICLFDFKVGHRYKMPATQAKYSSRSVRKQLKGWHYQTNCREMPILSFSAVHINGFSAPVGNHSPTPIHCQTITTAVVGLQQRM